MFLCSWHILLLGVVCSLILFTISHGNFSVHFTSVLLFTWLPEWALGFKWTIYYFIYKIKGNIGTVSHWIFQSIIKNWHRFFLCNWCSAVENTSGLHFSVYTGYFSVGRVTPFWNNDHLNMLDVCGRLLPVQGMFLQASRRFSYSSKCGALPRKSGTRTQKCVCVQPFSSAYEYPFLQF